MQGEVLQDRPPAPNRSRAWVAIVFPIEKPTKPSDSEHDIFGRREVVFKRGEGFRHRPQHVEFGLEEDAEGRSMWLYPRTMG